MNLIYVWVGNGANKEEKQEAENIAKNIWKPILFQDTKKASIEVIYQGKETPTFKKYFPSWDDKLFNDDRSVEKMRKLLFN